MPNFTDTVILILVAMMCAWSGHSYMIAVSSTKEARAMARKSERRVRVERMLETHDWRALPSCIVIHIDPVSLEPIEAA